MALLENRLEGFWVGVQTAKGTAATTAAKRGRKVGGGTAVNVSRGAEVYSDGNRFPSRTHYVDTVLGEGNPVMQMQPDVTGYLNWLILGSETVVGAADPFTHTAKPTVGSPGKWFSSWKLVGESIVQRQRHADCRMTSLRMEASAANKVAKITPSFTILDPGEVVNPAGGTAPALPAAADSGNAPVFHTESEGAFQINAVVHRGIASWAVVINDAVTPAFGDAVTPYDVAFGMSEIMLDGITLLVDGQGLTFYNVQTYGSATPAAGTKPQKVVPAAGAFTVDMVKSANRSVKIACPDVLWAAPPSIEGNPEGGVTELALAATANTPGTGDIISVISKSSDPAYA